jgi:restriction system protein
MNLIIDILFFIFAFWPLMLLAPLEWRKDSIRGMLIIWCFFAVIRLIGFITGQTIPVFLIPEPLNTVIFFTAGAILLIITGLRSGLPRWNIRKKAEEAKSVEDLRRLSPTEFEAMVVELFTAEGHKARRTGAIGDHGVDVVIQAANGEKWVVQCKRWRGSVGEPVIRDFHGVMQHEKADKGAIITNGTFTPQAKEWARGKPLSLMEGDEFLSLLKKARGTHRPITSAAAQATEATPPLCPKCGSQMVVRIAKQGPNTGGKFWGCPKYPNCRGILKYEP